MVYFGKRICFIMKIMTLCLSILLLGACSDNSEQLNADYGDAQVRERIVSASDPLADQYLNEVKPIIENRCVVCHGCYDAPCQLKLSSPEGIDRGFSPEQVNAIRLSEVDPTRIFIDGKNTHDWRIKDKPFKPVLNERDQTPIANLEGSIFYKMLEQKRIHPLPGKTILPEDSFDFSLNREETCASIETFDKYQKEFPLGGMPYGLPEIDKSEFNVLENWLEQGAAMAQPKALTPSIEQQLIKWEAMLNGRDNKSRLVSRYIYEHLFIAHLYFSDEALKDGELPDYFRLVRSTTPPGQAIDEIATRRPYEDPNVEAVYYRLRRDTGTIISKTHMPYALNKKREVFWNELFYQNPFSVPFLPGYKNSNPFLVFASIPSELRYRFLLDEAQFTIMGFIKGPVCRGQIALGVIQDKFWVFFQTPDYLASEKFNNFIYDQAENLELPSDYSARNYATTSWLKFSKREKSYLQAQQDYYKNLHLEEYAGQSALWKGNSNSALTVIRNFDSAVVLKGLQGETPKTAWIINYPVLERIHYLLVAGFDIYGSIKHQLVTRLYMDLLRIESEMSFISLLPVKERRPEIESWYIDSTKKLETYLQSDHPIFTQENSVIYKTDNYKEEVLTRIKVAYEGLLSPSEINVFIRDITDGPLTKLNKLPNIAVQQLSETSFIYVEDNNGKATSYTLMRHNEHSNVASILKEADARLPHLDNAEVYKGFVGSYPLTIFNLTTSQQAEFVEQLSKVHDALSYEQLLDKFAVRRSNPDFWTVSDKIHQLHKQDNPISYGLFDYNRLDNR